MYKNKKHSSTLATKTFPSSSLPTSKKTPHTRQTRIHSRKSIRTINTKINLSCNRATIQNNNATNTSFAPTFHTTSKFRFSTTIPLSSPPSMDSTNLTTITPRLQEVREQLKTTAEKFNRNPASVQLLAVSKTHPNDAIQEAYNLGQRAFGENYVNELIEKAPQLPLDIQWHFIGQLQSNKCKFLAQIPNLAIVESIDSIKLAGKLNTELKKAGWGEGKKKMGVLAQVNTSDEDQKGGVWGFEQCQELVTFIQKECDLLQFQGLMTIGKVVDEDNPTAAPYFEMLVEYRDKLLAEGENRTVKHLDKDTFILSMGMTHDFETAIQYGSTEIRVGTAIFGNRVYLNKASGEVKDVQNHANVEKSTESSTTQETETTPHKTEATTTPQ